MAKGMMKGGAYQPGKPKKTRQGRSARTLLSATSRNGAKKRYRGQGKQLKTMMIHGCSYLQLTFCRSMGA